MKYNLLGKEVRGRFGFPSGVIATNSDTARWMIQNIHQIGFLVGKSTTIEPREGNKEDILSQSGNSLGNAVGYTNPGLEAMIEEFCELRESTPDDVFLMPQIGESNEENFAYCAREFDKLGNVIDGIELNVSCPHADKGGILIGSKPEMVASIVAAARKATKKPIVVKLNAGVPNIENIAAAAIDAGADAISAINTLGGPNPELYNEFGGLSGARIFPVTCATVRRIKNKLPKVPMIVMGGISNAQNIRTLDSIDNKFFYAIGTALAGFNSEETVNFFDKLEKEEDYATEFALSQKNIMEYKPFIVQKVEELSENLKKITFYQEIWAEAGQFVFLKVDNKHSKPFSVADTRLGLEIVVRKVGETTSKIFDLKENNVVRIRGPYGKKAEIPQHRETVVYVGAGCGIAPIHNASLFQLTGRKIFVLGAKTAKELFYLKEFKEQGDVFISTDDGSHPEEIFTGTYKGTVTDLLHKVLKEERLENPYFFNCGPEVVLAKADAIEKEYTTAENIYHLVERMTSCGIGICGKCSIPNGKRACVDGPVFTAKQFKPGKYTRDKTGKKVYFEEK